MMRIFEGFWTSTRAVLVTITLLVVSNVTEAAGIEGDSCWAGALCGAGLSCQPGVHRCFPVPRQRGDPCSLGFGCEAGLTCEAGSQVCVEPSQHGGACHATRPCVDGTTCQPGSHLCYNSPRTVGEPCSAGFACGNGLECAPFAQKCLPKNFAANDDNACFVFFDVSTARTAANSKVTTTYGYGNNTTLTSADVTYEVGVIYGQNGRYGCYQSECGGFSFDMATSGFFSIGTYTSFDDVAGSSEVYGGGISLPVIEAGVGIGEVISTGAEKKHLGVVWTFGVGVGFMPVKLNAAKCTTTVNEIDIDSMRYKLGITKKEWIKFEDNFNSDPDYEGICHVKCIYERRDGYGYTGGYAGEFKVADAGPPENRKHLECLCQPTQLFRTGPRQFSDR